MEGGEGDREQPAWRCSLGGGVRLILFPDLAAATALCGNGCGDVRLEDGVGRDGMGWHGMD